MKSIIHSFLGFVSIIGLPGLQNGPFSRGTYFATSNPISKNFKLDLEPLNLDQFHFYCHIPFTLEI